MCPTCETVLLSIGDHSVIYLLSLFTCPPPPRFIRQYRQAATRLPLALGLGSLLLGTLATLATIGAAEPSEHFSARLADGGRHAIEPDRAPREPELRLCSVHDLLPLSCQSKSREWSDEYVTDLPYDCTCATTKAR